MSEIGTDFFANPFQRCNVVFRAKGSLSNKTTLAMVFKLVEGAQQLPKVVQGVKFADGLEINARDDDQAQTATA